MSDTKTKIICSVVDGNFLEVIYQAYCDFKNDPDETLGLILAGLHNEGQLNLLDEFLKLKHKESEVDFFSLMRVFANALPILEATVDDVMSTVKHLTTQAEGDMVQYLLIGPFIEYCKKSPSTIKEVLSVSLENVDETFDYVSPVLIAGSEIDGPSQRSGQASPLKLD